MIGKGAARRQELVSISGLVGRAVTERRLLPFDLAGDVC